MSLRKGLTLLLLAAFGLSSVAPAFSAVSVTVNNNLTPTIAQDAGLAASGAKPDVSLVDIQFTLGLGELDFASITDVLDDTTDISFDNDTDDDNEAGRLILVGGGTAANASAYFTPPTGCKFVSLPSYLDPGTATATNNSVDIDTSAGENALFNTSITSTGNLPGDNASASYVFAAQVLRDEAYGNASVGAGSLAIHGFTDEASTSNAGGPISITIQNIGLACDATNSPTTTGTVDITYVAPNANTVKSLFVSSAVSNGATFSVANYGSREGKLEALIAGQTTGNVAGTAEDSQLSSLISNTNLQNVSSLTFGPAEVTEIDGTTANLDIDAILIRAAESPESTASLPKFYATPFATAEFITQKSLDSDSAELINADLSNSSLFDNETNALINVDIEIKTFAGGASDATLSVTNAYVGVELPNSITNNGTATANGFLGAVSYPVRDTVATLGATADAALVSFDPSEAANFVVDGIALDGTLLVDEHGFIEAGTNGPLQTTVIAADASPSAVGTGTTALTFTSISTNEAFLFPGILIDDTLNGANSSVTISNTETKNATQTIFNLDADTALATSDIYRNARTVFSNLKPAVSGTDGTQYHLVMGDDNNATNVAKAEVILGSTNLFETSDEYNVGVEVEDSADSSGAVRTLAISTPGTSYDEAGAHALTQTSTSGSGTGFAASLNDDTGDADDVPDLEEITITTAGSGYAVGDTITLSDGDAGTDLVVSVTDIGSDDTFNDNVVLASRLVSAGDNKKFTVQILPFTNKYDSVRDVISVRPQGTVTFGSATLTDGLKITATVSGNNLNSSTELTLGSILPSGAGPDGLTVRTLPVSGDMDQLLSENETDPTLNRAEFNPASLTGLTTATDSFADLLGSGTVLDDTVPPFFGCGVAGNGLAGANARGPLPCIQPKARALAIEEAESGDFQEINDLSSSVRIRVTLPAGTDINLWAAEASAATSTEYDDILNIIGTGGFGSAISVANNVTNVQPVSSTVSQAFIDIDIPTVSTTTQTITRGLYLIFRPDALVVPEGVSDLNLSVSIVDTGATAGATSDDTVLSTIGTSAIASELSTFLNVAFAPSTVSNYQTGTVTTGEDFVGSTVLTKYGSQETTFASAPANTTRFLNSTGTSVDGLLWDVIITEGVADALPFGGITDGIPGSYLNGADPVTTDDKQIRCVFENPTLVDGVDNDAGNNRIFFSDSSITSTETTNNTADVIQEEGTAGNDAVNGFLVPLRDGILSGAPNARDELTSITVRGIRFEDDGNQSVVTNSDLACWFEVDDDADNFNTDDDDSAVVGSLIGLATGGDNTTLATSTSTTIVPIVVSDNTTAEAIAERYFKTTNASIEDVQNGAGSNIFADYTDTTELANAVFNSNFIDSDIVIEDAISFVIDDSSTGAKLLDGDTPLSLTSTSLPQINGADDTTGDLQITVSAATGTLEAGTLITITPSSPTSPAESVTVPVLDDGSFTAVLRAAPTATLTVTQAPTTGINGANIQLQVLNVTDAGVTPDPTDDPTITGPVADALVSDLVEGEIVVLFEAPETSNFTFADVAETATVNNVQAIALGDRFAAVVPAATTYTLSVTVDGTPVQADFDIAPTAKTSNKSIKRLNPLKTDKNGRYVIRQKNNKKLPKDVNLELVYSDGTTAVVANADLTRNKKGRIKFDNPEADKEITYVQVLSAARGSRVAQ